jgi:RHS repeat-associated protein
MTAKAYGLPDSARKQLVFSYDFIGRRVQKVVLTGNGPGLFSNPMTTKFVYDGWNLLAELDGDNNNAVKCSYMWGLDLSGSIQGAGGAGGLLTASPGGTNAHFVIWDANGNVNALTDSSGKISARYEYSLFGETLRATGRASGLNSVRNCGRYVDAESGFVCYPLRFQNPGFGWLNRDPITENGGINLWAMIP